MVTLNPFTERDAQEKARRDRATHVHLAGIQMERLLFSFDRTKKVNHELLQRLIQTLLKVGGHIPMTHERAESLEAKLKAAVTDDGEYTLRIQGNRIYIEGYFDLNKLKNDMLW
jgi:hypothetical protein